MKRATDIILGGLLAIVAAPVILALALVLAVSLRAFPFFVQERIGFDGRPFRLVKLRTLPRKTPPYADKYTIAGVKIPRFARLLRRLHLDELPQLFLVPIGRMSLVGPRPEMPALHDRLPNAFAERRTSVRPGCTGLWQIGLDSGGLIGETPYYDEFYLHHRSNQLDLWILAQTAKLMAGRGRQFRISDIPPDLRRQTAPHPPAAAISTSRSA